MALEKFDITSLATIDGGEIREAFEDALKRCRLDCQSRPGVQKPRKVSITANLVPICDDNGKLGSCDVQFEVTDSLPKRVSPNYNMKATRTGLLFNEESPQDVNQGTLDDYAEKAKAPPEPETAPA